MPKVAFYTLGCKVNQYESDAMAELFINRGYDVVDFDSVADVYVINTCDVTNESARKSRQILRKASRRNPNAIIAAVGCYAQLESEQISKIDGIDVIVGTRDRHLIVDLVEEAKAKDRQIVAVKDIMEERNFENIGFKGYRQKTRAFLKIQEGCNMFCSYCIIPYARGPIRSRSIESILQEAENLIREGFKEIVLTGIHLGLYGHDFGKSSPQLIDVIMELSKLNGLYRIRLSSIEALELTDEFVQVVKQLKNFCNHFHIPLQSGCNKILKLMHRRYDTSEFKQRMDYIRRQIDDVAITTDVIVGFPGETDEDFDETYEFIKEIGFSKLHVFPFSPRKGTPAAAMEGRVSKVIKEQRSHKLIELSHEFEKQFRETFEGKIMNVLFEERIADGMYEGLTTNYIKVRVKSEEDLHNRIVPIKLIQNYEEYILGKIVENKKI